MTDILIFSGQSNMQGQTESRPNTRPVPNAYEYLLMSRALIPLNHPVGEDYRPLDGSKAWLSGSHQKSGSLVPAFCRAYLKTRDKAVAIHAAQGATTVSEWEPGGVRYELMKAKVTSGIKAAGDTDTIGHRYFIWLQGESDALEHVSREDYLRKLIAFKNAVKADLGIEKFCIIRVGYFAFTATWFKEGTAEERRLADEAIMTAQEDAVRLDDDFVMLTDITKDLSLDPVYLNPYAEGHYNNKALDLIGRTAGRALAKITG